MGISGHEIKGIYWIREDDYIVEGRVREVQEETGLHVHEATLISIYTEPRFSVVNPYGDEYQGFEFLYRVDRWSDSIVNVTDETTCLLYTSPSPRD